MAKAKKKAPAKNKKAAVPKKKASAAKKAPAVKSSPKKSAKKAPAQKTASSKSGKKATAPKKAIAQKTATRRSSPAPKSSLTGAVQRSLSPTTAKIGKTKFDLTGLMTPLEDRVLIQLTESDRRTQGGLFIPDTVADFSGNLEGKVVACGAGYRSKKGHLRPMDLKVGDRVVFSEYAGTRIRLFDQDLVILHETEVTGVLS